MTDYANSKPAPVSPPASRTPLSAREARAVAMIADRMLTQGYRPKRLRHDRPEIVEALAAEIARRTKRLENDVRRDLAVKHGALIYYDGAPQP
jgi:hypothetical protein